MNGHTAQTSNPKHPSRLLVERLSPSARETLWRLVRSIQDGDPMAPVTVVAPTRFASLSLRHDLGLQGFANVKFMEMPRLAELLGAASLAGRRPLTGVLQSILLRKVLEQADGPLAPVRDHTSTQNSLRASFGDLRNLDDEPLHRLEAPGGISGEVARLYGQFRSEASEAWYDAEDLAVAASEAIRHRSAPALGDLGHILFYLPRRVSLAQSDLMRALAEHGRCSVILGVTSDEAADAPARDVAAALEPILGARVGPGDARNGLPVLPGETHLHVAPTSHEELRWVARRIVEEATANGTPFHRMAVLYRVENPYATLVRDELQLAGLPLAGPGRDTLADTGIGRTLTGLLELSRGDFTRSEVMAWLNDCPVRPHDRSRAGFNPSRWDSLARRAGIIGGRGQWRERLGGYAQKLVEDADRREADGEISDARAFRMREEARTAAELMAFVERLADDVQSPAGSTWKDHSEWAAGLLDKYLSRDVHPQEAGLRDRIDQIIRELGSADSVRSSTTLDEFRRTVADSMRTAVGRLGATGQGVFVSPFAAAAGMSFDVAWLVGMIEGGAPPALPPDPLLPETVWREAGGPPRRETRIAQERYDFLSAAASAPRRFLSYPIADAASQRQVHPSRWMLEQASVLEGSPVHTSGLARLSDRPWLSVDVSAERALAAASDSSLADGHDYYLNRLVLWRGAGERFADHSLVRSGILARADTLGRSRFAYGLTEFDGNLTSVAASAMFAGAMAGAVVSPTSLETWAGCPYRYFLGYVLRLSALETPEETAVISALERGSLVHGILERFISEAEESGTAPRPGAPWSEEGYRRLMAIAEESFADAEARGVTGKPLLWELARQDIRDDLTTFLEAEARLREDIGTGYVLTEARFGLGGDSPEVTDEATGLTFRGVIDRLDVNAAGDTAVVIDYKTGSSAPYRGLEEDPIDRGRRLQLGVYSLAARRMVPNVGLVKAAYWFTTNRGGFALHPKQFLNVDESETSERFRYGVTTIVDGVRAGVFPANPGPLGREGKPENCRYCDFDSLCPSRRVDMWRRKKDDSLLHSYVRLAEDGSGGGGE